MLNLALLLLGLGPLLVAGHGNMVWPPTWFDADGKDGLMPGGVGRGENLPMMWFSNWTTIPEDQEATIDPLFFTVPDFHGDAYTIWDRVNCFLFEDVDYDVCKAWYPTDPARNPWMAPGTAPVYSPCGWAGGNPEGCGGVPYGKECPGGGFSIGYDSLDVIWNDTVTTQWVRGGVAEVRVEHKLQSCCNLCLCLSINLRSVCIKRLLPRLVGASWQTMAAATATDCARSATVARPLSPRNVSSKRRSILPPRTAGCNTGGTQAPESSSEPTERERAPFPSAPSGR